MDSEFWGEPINKYTSEQAIEDGALAYPMPEKFPNLLLSASVHADCESQEGRTYEQCVVPLVMDVAMQMNALAEKGKPDFPVVLENTVAGTVWAMPNDMGGITLMKPEDY